MREGGYFYSGNAQGSSATLLDPIIRVGAIFRLQFILSLSSSERGRLFLHWGRCTGYSPPLNSTPLSELTTFFKSTPLLKSTSLWFFPLHSKVGYFYTRTNVQGTPITPLDPIIRVDSPLQVHSILRVHFIMSRSFTEPGWLFLHSEKCAGFFHTSSRPHY